MSDGWQGLLEPDEEIVWQGAPSGRVRLEWTSPMVPFFFLFFTGFSVFWMVMASLVGGFFWTVGLLFFGPGVFNLVGVHFWKAYERRNTHYTLTNKRALIGSRSFGRRKLDSYRILPSTPLIFEESARDGDIFFAENTNRTKNGAASERIGFILIEDARTVLGHMNKIQQEGAKAG